MSNNDSIVRFDDLVGCVIARITGCRAESERVEITLSNGRKFALQHQQQCCEDVSVEDVCGDPEILLWSPVVLAHESSSEVNDQHRDVSETWTFYRIGTVRGTVVIRWYGTSNGYYSEAVDFQEVPQ